MVNFSQPGRPMAHLKLASTKITPELVERLNRYTESTGLTQSAAIRQAIELFLDSVESTKSTELTDIEGSFEPVALGARVDRVDVRLTDIEARLTAIESRSVSTTVKPIAGSVGDALTTGEAWENLYGRKLYRKQLAAFRTALRRARELDPPQLSDELVSIGLVADFETRLQANPKDKTVRWLRIQ